MDIERPHRTTTTTSTNTTTSELFICFTSRLSNSSSMRRSSKSILSPSLSRRLRHSGSLRGGAQSPALFPSNVTKKNRGSSVFSENKEPSSPKVTCIGQVRVKTKKQGKKIKLRACGSKRINGGDTKFIKVEEEHRNLETLKGFSICETLKGFGIPCKSSCFSSGNKREKSCFRWLVSLQEGEGKRRDIELVVGGEEDEIMEERGRVIERECSRRRSIFDDMEFDDLFSSNNNNVGSNDNNNNNNDSENVEESEEKGRVSVCVPPKNALLLMRCRSDPKRMASLSQKFLDGSFVQQVDDQVVEVKEEDFVEVDEKLGVEIEEEICVQVGKILGVEEEKCDFVDENLMVREEEVIDTIKEENCVQVDEKLGVEEEEVIVIKEENCALVDEGLEEEKREESVESVKLEEVEDKIDEICEDLEVVEVKIEDLVVSSEDLEEKVEEVEDERQEEIEEVRLEEQIDEKHGVENIEKEEQVLPNLEETLLMESGNFANGCSIEAIKVEEDGNFVNGCSIETINVEEKVEGGNFANGCSIKAVTIEEFVREGENFANGCLIEGVKIEEIVKEGENFANGCSIEGVKIEEIVKEGENFANECLIEAIAIEEEVKVYENAQELVVVLEDQVMKVQEERVIEESCELFTNSSSPSCTSLQESKELDPKQEKIEVEKVLVVEKQEGRKSMEKEKTKTKPTLPDCLLLMMCEPKLSMEVSKETWISSTDFIRCLPERHHSKKPKKTETSEGSDDQSSIDSKKAKSAAIAAQLPLPPVGQMAKTGIQPGRSSISFPASSGSMANLIEQKLAKAGVGVGYEPFVLPRCKSAPMRSTAKFGCKLEPHRSATCGVGAAGIGF